MTECFWDQYPPSFITGAAGPPLIADELPACVRLSHYRADVGRLLPSFRPSRSRRRHGHLLGVRCVGLGVMLAYIGLLRQIFKNNFPIRATQRQMGSKAHQRRLLT